MEHTLNNEALTMPTISMSGTSKVTLLEDYMKAKHGLQHAFETLRNVEFHMRDYQHLGQWEKALADRNAVFTMMREIEEYYEKHLEHLS